MRVSFSCSFIALEKYGEERNTYSGIWCRICRNDFGEYNVGKVRGKVQCFAAAGDEEGSRDVAPIVREKFVIGERV